MIRVLLNGANGHMGRVVASIAAGDPDITIVGGVDIAPASSDAFPVFSSYEEVNVEADVIIDFSVASAVDAMLSYGREKKIPMVICTTGLSDEQLDLLTEASKVVAVFRSGNMSLGINLLQKLIGQAATVLMPAGFDAEIEEIHHRRKVDAPSGTALMLADAIRDSYAKDYDYVYDRSERRQARPKKEIGITSLRGGTVTGIHNVLFAGEDEVIEIRHTAYSRDVFAKGAVEAARYLAGKGPGLYSMSDVIDG